MNANDDPTKFLMSRRSKLSYKASILIDDASLTDEKKKFLDEQLDYIHGKIKKMSISPTTKYNTQKRKCLDIIINIGNPSQIRTKGRGKRILSSKEKTTVKPRACHGCGLHGASHDKRNCINLHDWYVYTCRILSFILYSYLNFTLLFSLSYLYFRLVAD